MHGGNSAQGEDSRRGPALEKKNTANYGLFLGGGGSSMPPRSNNMERSKTSDGRAMAADQGNTIISNESAANKNGFARDRSLPFARSTSQQPQPGGSFDNRGELDSRSIGGRSREESGHNVNPSPSPTINSIINASAPHANISIHDNKREYLKEKERKDLEQLENDLSKERAKLAKYEDQF